MPAEEPEPRGDSRERYRDPRDAPRAKAAAKTKKRKERCPPERGRARKARSRGNGESTPPDLCEAQNRGTSPATRRPFEGGFRVFGGEDLRKRGQVFPVLRLPLGAVPNLDIRFAGVEGACSPLGTLTCHFGFFVNKSL